jgi:Fe-S-cluster-containing hydrogenase component 2
LTRYVLDVVAERCTGCMKCVYACSWVKDGVLDPEHARIKVVSKGGVVLDVTLCRHCKPAPCVEVCEFDALKIEEDGTVVLDEDKCTDCKACRSVCPFGAITDSGGGMLIKCDLCGGDPECVKVCPYNALIFRPVTSQVPNLGGRSIRSVRELMEAKER